MRQTEHSDYRRNAVPWAFAGALAAGLLVWAVPALSQTPILVADINTGNGPILGSDPSGYTRLTATQTVFAATDPAHGRELWITDGTTANTHLLFDFCPGSCSGNPLPLNPNNAVALGVLYISADDGALGAELWKVTSAGVVSLVKDINPGALGSNPGSMAFTTAAPTIGYFAATAAASGTELWKTNGTSAGTVLVKDINGGTASSSPLNLGAGSNHVYFAANEPSTGTELYVSDGTNALTLQRDDINVGSAGSSPSQFAQLTGDTMVFEANDGAAGKELWITTPTSTNLLKDIATGSFDSNPSGLVPFNGFIYFSASATSTSPFDRELWITTGTPTGTVPFKDICPGPCSSSPYGLTTLNTAAGARLLFLASPGGADYSVYVSDGATITLILDTNSTNVAAFTVSGALAYFVDQANKKLYRTDGTALGTIMVKDFGAANFVSVGAMGAIGTNKVVIAADDGFVGNEPYIAGPNGGNLSLLKNIGPDLGYSNPQDLTNVNGTLYFTAFSDTTGRELWKVVDPNLGAELVTDLVSGAVGSNPSNLIAFNGKLLFLAPPAAGSKLKIIYVNDAAGTHPLKDLGPAANLSYQSCLTVVGNRIYFNADGADGKGVGPWTSDGTDAGTIDVNPDGIAAGSCQNSEPGFALAGTKVLFEAGDTPRGQELYRTDGTALGTALLRDIVPGALGSAPKKFVSIGNLACFTILQDGIADEEPWCSDGTSQGTVALGDLNPGAEGSQPLSLTPVGKTLVFSAFSPPTFDRRMWRSDGTTASAVALTDGYNLSYSLVGLATTTFPGSFRLDPPSVQFDGNEIYYACADAGAALCIQDVRPGFQSMVKIPGISSGANVGAVDQVHVFPGGDVLMSCWTATAGRELCRFRSGPLDATSPLADIAPGAASSSPEQITPVGNYIYFTADDGAHGRELWAVPLKDVIDRIFHGDFD